METAQRLVEALFAGKIISRLRRKSGGDSVGGCFEVLVPSTELEAAQDLIFENEF